MNSTTFSRTFFNTVDNFVLLLKKEHLFSKKIAKKEEIVNKQLLNNDFHTISALIRLSTFGFKSQLSFDLGQFHLGL